MNVLQRVIESLLFFHPAVWWVSRQITNEREHACDELVLTVGPGRAQYADALVRMAELSCQRSQLPVTALATTGSSTTAFKRRVLKVLEMDAAPTLRPSRIAAVMASLVVLFALAIPLFLSGSLAGGQSGENQDREEMVNQRNLIAANDEQVAQPPTPEVQPPRVELVGLTWNRVPRNNAWQPNGSSMALPEWAKSIPQLGPEGTEETPVLLYKIHGLRDTPSVNFHESSISTGDQELTGAVFHRAMIRFQAVGETANETPKISISDEPWGPWRTITKSGEMSSPVSDDSPYRLGYAMVTAHGIRPLRRNTHVQGLILQYPKEFRDLYDFEIEELSLSPTIDPSEIRQGDSSPVGEGNNASVEIEFPLPSHADLKEYRYRIRPYRHQFVFENVNFAPSQKPANYTPFKTVYKKLEHDLPKPAGPRVELIGLTWDTVPKTEVWTPSGLPMPLPEWVQQLPQLIPPAPPTEKDGNGPLFIYELHGLNGIPSIQYEDRTLNIIGDRDLPVGRPYRLAVFYERMKAPIDLLYGSHPAVRISDEPWGPWRTITKQGQLEGFLDDGTLYPEGYGGVTAHGFRPLTKEPNDLAGAINDPVQQGLVLHSPRDYAIEIEGVPETTGPQPQPSDGLPGRVVKLIRNEAKERWEQVWEWPVDPAKIDHIRFRIRPFRHRFEFQEVAYTPGQRPARSAPFKLIYRKLEHDMPKQVDAQIKATLPGGLELELLGVAPFREPGKESWTPYGKKFEPAPDWAGQLKVDPLPPSGLSDWVNEDYRDFIVWARGFTPEQLALLPFLEKFESGDSTIGRMQVLTWNQQVQRLRIGIPGEWGPYQILRVDSKVAPNLQAVEVPAEVPAPFRKVYDMIQPRLEASDARLERWQSNEMKSLPPDFRPGDPDPDFEPGSRVRIVWKGIPTNQDLKYTLREAVVVDRDGQRHTIVATTAFVEPEGGHQWDVDIFDVPIGKVSHIEYRLRPYQHVVTFNNVALHPGVACGPNVVVESPLAVAGNAANSSVSTKLKPDQIADADVEKYVLDTLKTPFNMEDLGRSSSTHAMQITEDLRQIRQRNLVVRTLLKALNSPGFSSGQRVTQNSGRS